MITLTFPSPAFQRLKDDLAHEILESAAILLCAPVKLSGDKWRLVVREAHVAHEHAYLERTAISVRLDPHFCLPLEKKAHQNGWSLVYVHTHPSQAAPEFSAVDDKTEVDLAKYVAARSPGVPHAALLFSKTGVTARLLGTDHPVRVIEVGEVVGVYFDEAEPEHFDRAFDRQIRAFGASGQARLSRLHVAIVGLGGTGSLILEQLAHLGVGEFTLVDPDIVESTNLNRIAGAERGDLGKAKVQVAARLIRSLRSDTLITELKQDITYAGAARRVVEADFIFCCTDTHASRHVLNQAAYQYLVPLIDLGVAITVESTDAVRFSGHVKMMAPTLPCLWCVRHLDPKQVREELMTEVERAADPYFQGGTGVVQPAVISLNGVVASLAVTMFLGAMVGIPTRPRYLLYDGNRGRVSELAAVSEATCNFCGPDSPACWGDTFPLPERRDGKS